MNWEKYSDHALYQLVRSLTRSEKKLFSSWAEGRGDKGSKYYELYRLIQQQEPYDPQALRLRMDKSDRNFRALKKYLFDKLLGFLARQLDYSPRTDIHHLLSQAEVLYLKGMPQDAQVALHQALLIARRFEFIEEKVTILEWMYKIRLHLGMLSELGETLDEMEQNLMLLQELMPCKQLARRVQELEKQIGVPRNEAGQAEYHQLLAHPLLATTTRPKGIRAQLTVFTLRALALRMSGQYPASVQELKAASHLLESQPDVRLSIPNQVIPLYKHLLLSLLALQQYEEFDHYGQVFAQTRFLSLTQNRKAQLLAEGLSLRAAILRKDEDQALALARSLVKAEALPQAHDSLLVELRLTAIFALLWLDQNAEAAHELSLLMGESENYDRSLFYEPYVRMIDILIQYQLNHVDVLPHRIRAARSWFRRHQMQFPAETCLLEHLQQEIKGHVRDTDWLPVFVQEQEQLREQNLLERHFLYFYDLGTWVERRMALLAV